MSQRSADGTATLRTVPDFAFLTNHGKTLLLIARDQRIRMRDMAGLLHITERATQRIVADLAKAGYIDREREGQEKGKRDGAHEQAFRDFGKACGHRLETEVEKRLKRIHRDAAETDDEKAKRPAERR